MTARWLTHDEIEVLDCAMTAGLTPTPETVARMMATIKQLRRELVQQASRSADENHRPTYVSAQVEQL